MPKHVVIQEGSVTQEDDNLIINSGGTRERKIDITFVGHGVGGTKTVTYIHDCVIGEKFGIGDILYVKFPVPDDYDSGDMTLQVDIETTANEATKESRWEVKYKAHNHGEVTTGTTRTVTGSDIAMEDNTQYYAEPGMDVTITAADFAGKDYIKVCIERIAITGGAEATDPGVITIELEYTAKQIAA